MSFLFIGLVASSKPSALKISDYNSTASNYSYLQYLHDYTSKAVEFAISKDDSLHFGQQSSSFNETFQFPEQFTSFMNEGINRTIYSFCSPDYNSTQPIKTSIEELYQLVNNNSIDELFKNCTSSCVSNAKFLQQYHEVDHKFSSHAMEFKQVNVIPLNTVECVTGWPVIALWGYFSVIDWSIRYTLAKASKDVVEVDAVAETAHDVLHGLKWELPKMISIFGAKSEVADSISRNQAIQFLDSPISLMSKLYQTIKVPISFETPETKKNPEIKNTDDLIKASEQIVQGASNYVLSSNQSGVQSSNSKEGKNQTTSYSFEKYQSVSDANSQTNSYDKRLQRKSTYSASNDATSLNGLGLVGVFSLFLLF